MSSIKKAPNIRYREANVADCPGVANVHVRAWRESFAEIVPQAFLDKMSIEKRTLAFAKRLSDESYRMYVAEVPERGVVGFVDFGEPRESIDAYETELYAIYILPEFQRRGVGRRLFDLGVEALVRDGKNSMYLLALEVSPYKSFYEKMGGQVVGRKRKEIEGVMFDVEVHGWDSLALSSRD
jgi:ribosomal protein S18 acetylase RimI-like enzyme